MTIGELQYLITVNDKTDDGIRKSEGKIKKAEKQLTAYGIARAQMVMDFAKKAATSAVNAFKNTVKSAVSAYADYEQLVGGVETLFGAAAGKVMDNAQKAFKTAGLSANEYMETVTSFSAALISSLDGDTNEAARLADQALLDMSDNANKMGSSMESIQNAYQGFAKQNYTMLDNLKLGFGGTKSEMERLITKANELRAKQGKNADLTIEKYSDVIEAIHTIQEEMKITGTTSDEAEKTISGSIKMTKAAWKNLLTAIGSGRDVKKATKEFTDSFKKTITNIVPVAKRSISGIFEAVKAALPEIKEAVSEIWSEIKKLFSNSPIMRAITEKIDGLMGLFRLFSDLITDFEGTMATLEGSNSPMLKGFAKIVRLGQALIDDINEGIDDSGSLLFGTLKGATKFITDALKQAADWLGDSANVQKIVDILKNVLSGLAQALPQIVTTLIPALAELVGKLAPALIDVVVSILGNKDVWASLAYMFDSVLRSILGDSIVGSFLGKKKKLVHTKGDDGEDHVRLVDDVDYKESGDNAASKIISSLMGFEEGSAGKKITDFVFNDFLGTVLPNMFKPEMPTSKIYRLLHTGAKGIDMALGTDIAGGMDEVSNKAEVAVADAGMKTSFWIINAGREIEDAGENTKADLVNAGMGFSIDVANAANDFQSAVATAGAGLAKRFGGYEEGSTEANLFDIVSHFLPFAKGNWSVPYDNFPALLHRDEMVLTKSQARQFRDGAGGGGISGDAIAAAVETAMSRVYVMMSGEKVGDLTTRRIKKNLNASNYARMRALGG